MLDNVSLQAAEQEKRRAASLASEADELSRTLRTKVERIEQLQRAEDTHKMYVGGLEDSLEAERRAADGLRLSVADLQERLRLEAVVSEQLSASVRLGLNDEADSEAGEVEAELRRQVEDLQVELEDNKEEFDHLTAVSAAADYAHLAP